MNFDLEQRYTRHTDSFPPTQPLIAITGNHGEKGCELADGYYRSILAAGGCPVVLPPSDDPDALLNLLERIDGILLSGGSDLNPLWMGEDPIPELGSINPARDAQELLLVQLATDRQIPLLGICRGMQIIAAAMGGKVCQDMKAQRLTTAPPLLKHAQNAPRNEPTHRIETVEGTLLRQLLGESAAVNSFHHQAVVETGCRLRPAAFAADGTIEAIESTEHRSVLGVQWHPECMTPASMLPLFRHLVEEAERHRRAHRFHDRHLTIDSHCDTPMFFDQDIDFNRRDPRLLVDIHKMTEGRLDASIMVAYLPQGERSADAHRAATQRAHSILDRLDDMVRRCPQARLAYTPDDLAANKAAGWKSIMPAIENGYAFGTDLANVERFRRRGVVYTTLCHNGNNALCDSARPSPDDLRRNAQRHGAEHGGLSPFGRNVVREMNRVGMMVDLSHAAESSFYDALQCSSTPIVCSHSSARSLCDHPRNLTDHQLRALAESGGVAQCTFYKGFLRRDADRATIDDAVKHLLHMIAVAGIAHVGIGTDFDGDGGVPGLADASQLIALTRRLQSEGLTEADLALLWGGNFLRVMQTVQATAEILH